MKFDIFFSTDMFTNSTKLKKHMEFPSEKVKTNSRKEHLVFGVSYRYLFANQTHIGRKISTVTSAKKIDLPKKKISQTSAFRHEERSVIVSCFPVSQSSCAANTIFIVLFPVDKFCTTFSQTYAETLSLMKANKCAQTLCSAWANIEYTHTSMYVHSYTCILSTFPRAFRLSLSPRIFGRPVLLAFPTLRCASQALTCVYSLRAAL